MQATPEGVTAQARLAGDADDFRSREFSRDDQ